MTCAAKYDIEVCKAKNFLEVYRWEAGPVIYKAISAVLQRVPLRLTVSTHGFPDGWRLAISGANGMTEINAENEPPRNADYHRATVVDANTLEFNDINAEDFRAYTGGGYVRGYTPVSLSGYTAELLVKDKIGGTVLANWSSYVTINDAAKTITLALTAQITEALAFKKGVYELALTSSGGFVTSLLMGAVTVTDHVINDV